MTSELVYFDIEATGLNVWTDEIFQFCASHPTSGATLNLYIQTSTVPIYKKAAAVTGVYYVGSNYVDTTHEKLFAHFPHEVKSTWDPEDWTTTEHDYVLTPLLPPEEKTENPFPTFRWYRRTPFATPTEALLQIRDWFVSLGEGDKALVAYNGFGYDFLMLSSQLSRYQHSPGIFYNTCHITYFVDPLLYCKRFVDPQCLLRSPQTGNISFSQGNVYKSLFKEDFDNAHNAWADIEALCRICQHTEFQGLCELKADDTQNVMHAYYLSRPDFLTHFATKEQQRQKSIQGKIKRKTCEVPSLLSIILARKKTKTTSTTNTPNSST